MATLTTYYKGDMLFESKIGRHSVLIDVPEWGAATVVRFRQSFLLPRLEAASAPLWPSTVRRTGSMIRGCASISHLTKLMTRRAWRT